MKRRKTLIISLLLIAALCLGIGYASHTSDVTIGGQVNVDPDNNDFSVIFVSGSAKSSNEDFGTATISTTNTANFAIGKIEGSTDWMSASGDKVTFSYEISNESKDAQLLAYLHDIVFTEGVCRNSTTSTSVNIEDYFEVETAVYKLTAEGTTGAEMNTNDTLAKGEKARIDITVTLKQALEEGSVTWTGISYKLPFNSVAQQ